MECLAKLHATAADAVARNSKSGGLNDMYRILVTGGRDLPEAEVVWLPLWMLLHRKRSIVVVDGACPTGADLYAHEWVTMPEQPWNRGRRNYEPKVEHLALEEEHPAAWSLKGKSAGPLRNQEMVDSGADACFAFPTPKSRGTYDCMARCWCKGIPVYVWHHLDLGRHRRLTDAEGEELARKFLGYGR